jgi:hypothetical protein
VEEEAVEEAVVLVVVEVDITAVEAVECMPRAAAGAWPEPAVAKSAARVVDITAEEVRRLTVPSRRGAPRLRCSRILKSATFTDLTGEAVPVHVRTPPSLVRDKGALGNGTPGKRRAAAPSSAAEANARSLGPAARRTRAAAATMPT